MDETKETGEGKEAPEEPREGYVPRPAWQVWGARLGVVLMILFVIYQILSIARGGL